MTLGRLRAAQAYRAVKSFTDRDDARIAFNEAFSRYRSGRTEFSVLMFYGIGGVGKTTVLRHLQHELEESQKDAAGKTCVVSLNLEGPELGSPVDCLYAIRQQLPVAAPVFEYALARFYALEGRSLHELRRSRIPKGSLLSDLIDAACDAADTVVPARAIRRLWERGELVYLKQLYHDQLTEIDHLSDEELFARLPSYLALPIESVAETSAVVVFVDTHESIVNRPGFRTTKGTGDVWLQELIAVARKGMWVLAGRERLRWDDEDRFWDGHIDQNMLGAFIESDSCRFLEDGGVDDPGARQAIVEAAHGVPLYLALCASIYELKQKRGEPIDPAEFRVAERDVVARFVSHLDKTHALALEVCASMRRFDLRLFVVAMRALNIGVSAQEFDEFIASSYAEAIDSDQGVFKVHDELRAFLRVRLNKQVAGLLFDTMIAHASEGLSGGPSEGARSLWILEDALGLLGTHKVEPSASSCGRITGIGLDLIETGLWLGVLRATSKVPKTNGGAKQIISVLAMLEGWSYRKDGRLREAHEMLQQVDADSVGEYRSHLIFFQAHVIHLLGHYDQALKVYEQLSMLPEILMSRTTVLPSAAALAKRQRADLYMLKGRFQEALTAFRELKVRSEDAVWKAELGRFAGHVYRWNFGLDAAEAEYRRALAYVEAIHADAMRGKVLTNLAETLAWRSPNDALGYAEEALSIHEEVGNPIEAGKTLTAKAVALALSDSQLDTALRVSEEAEAVQAKIGYRSGLLFAVVAQAIVRWVRGEDDAVTRCLERFAELSAALNVYGYCVLPVLVLSSPPRLEAMRERFDWFDFDATCQAVRDNVSPLISGR